MNRYEVVFRNCALQKRGALVPFFMLAEPTIDGCLDWVDMLIENGADALELGMPFSDPVADGIVIQQSSINVLKNNITPDDCFNLIAEIRSRYADIPMGLLTYSNLVVARGLDTFYGDAASAGLDSVLLADIPAHAISSFAEAATENDISPILIAPPNAAVEQLKLISSISKGYTYVVSRAGVTGANESSGLPLEVLSELKKLAAPPAILGFGISTQQDVNKAITAGFSGAICGSALVKIQQQNEIKESLIKGAELMRELALGLAT